MLLCGWFERKVRQGLHRGRLVIISKWKISEKPAEKANQENSESKSSKVWRKFSRKRWNGSEGAEIDSWIFTQKKVTARFVARKKLKFWTRTESKCPNRTSRRNFRPPPPFPDFWPWVLIWAPAARWDSQFRSGSWWGSPAGRRKNTRGGARGLIFGNLWSFRRIRGGFCRSSGKCTSPPPPQIRLQTECGCALSHSGTPHTSYTGTAPPPWSAPPEKCMKPRSRTGSVWK